MVSILKAHIGMVVSSSTRDKEFARAPRREGLEGNKICNLHAIPIGAEVHFVVSYLPH